MKHFTYISTIVLALGLLVVLTCQPSANFSSSETPPAIPKQERINLSIQQEIENTRDPGTGTVPKQRLIAAKAYADRLISQQNVTRAGISGISWEERGPNNVGGRTRALHIDYYNPPVLSLSPGRLWAGSVSGGLWSTEDILAADPIWTSQDDFFANLSITCITQDTTTPDNLYFGTGEAGWFVVSGVRGMGIWKSTNGGTSWSQLASTAAGTTFRYVLDMEVDKNGNIYATTRDGLQRSTNDGASWTKVHGSGLSGGTSDLATDLEIAANGDIYLATGLRAHPGRIYVSRARLNTSGNDLGAAGKWLDVTPAAIVADTVRRIELACAPGDSNTVYALCQGNTPSAGVSRIFRTYDGGTSWASLPVPTVYEGGATTLNMASSQGWYNLVAGVFPTNNDSVFIGGLNSLRSLNGGASWTQINYQQKTATSPPTGGLGASQVMHVDHHDIEFIPVGRFAPPFGSYDAIWATDAGPYLVSNLVGPGLPTITDKRRGYNTTQFYGCEFHPTAGCDWYLAGAQDNGTQLFKTTGMNSTTEISGGDGGFSAINSLEPALQISSYIYNQFFVTKDSWKKKTRHFLNSRGRFINPWDYSDSLNTIFAGDASGSFFRWTGVDTASVASGFTTVSVPAFGGSTVSHVKVSPNKKDRVYFGLLNGDVVRVERADISPSPSSTDSVILSGLGTVSCIEVNPKNEDHIIVTYSNYGLPASVRETTDGGANWTNVEGNLPDMPVRWAVFAPDASDTVLLATELGVWSTDKLAGASTVWGPATIATNTPSRIANCRTDMLKVRPSDGLILAATHGRGLWTTDHFGKAVANFALLKSRAEESDAGGTYNPLHARLTECTGYNNHDIEITLSKALTVPCTLRVYRNSLSKATLAFTGMGDFAANPTMSTVLLSEYSTLIIPAGVTRDTITISIVNDRFKELTEKLFLELESQTSGCVVGKNSLHELSIIDNDASPSDQIRMLFKLGTSAPTKAPDLSGVPFGGGSEDGRYQVLLKASDLALTGLTAGDIDSVALYVSVKRSTQSYADFTVKMANTSLTTLSGAAYAPGTFTTVYSDSFTTDTGWVDIPFSATFSWDGTSSILMEYCFDNSSFTLNDDIAATSATGYTPVSYATGFFTAGCAISAPFATEMLQPEMYFYQSRERRPELGHDTVDAYISPGDTFHITSDAGDMMATIYNGTYEYRCTDIEIDRTGTGVTPFWNTDTAQQLFDRTLYIVPDTNSPAASQTYTLSLYFTQTELDAWTDSTGKTLADLKIVKTEGRPISDITPTAPASYYSDVSLHPGTIATYGTSAYSITATFSGFSGFGLGDPTPSASLPLVNLDLTAERIAENVDLQWLVNNELEVASYTVERAVDGHDFKQIAHIAPVSGSSGEKRYSYLDQSIVPGKLTYRILYTSLTGEEKRSNLATVFVEKKELAVSAYPNPFTDVIFLNLSGYYSSEKIEISLLDAQGKLLQKESNVVPSNGMVLHVKKNLPGGLYFVRIRMENGKELMRKVLKAS